MKKIIINSNILWTITRFRQSLIEELAQEYKVICIADSDDFSLDSTGVLQRLDVEFIQVNINRKGMNPLKDCVYFFRLLRLYRALRPDLVIHYTIKPNIFGSFASGILNIPSISVVTGIGSAMIHNNTVTQLVSLLYRWSQKKVSTIFFLNEDDKSLFVARGLAAEVKCAVLPGEGVNLNEFHHCDKTISASVPFVFLMVARLLKDKGVEEYLAAAAALHKQATFLLAGVPDKDNPSSIALPEINKYQKQGIISYLGATDQIKDFYKLADVIVLPSYREGLSRVLLEACSCEKLIVTSNIPGCKELCVDGYNGYLCYPRNVSSLIQAIEKTLLLSPDTIKLMGSRGRDLVAEHFSDTIVNAIMQKKIKEILR
ncbi:MAG: glycosyltransferase family 4 protein [Campylobacterales bacterium]|nr:glycosyltransferase family 4 protein [Campylobacterales bacterium]